MSNPGADGPFVVFFLELLSKKIAEIDVMVSRGSGFRLVSQIFKIIKLKAVSSRNGCYLYGVAKTNLILIFFFCIILPYICLAVYKSSTFNLYPVYIKKNVSQVCLLHIFKCTSEYFYHGSKHHDQSAPKEPYCWQYRLPR